MSEGLRDAIDRAVDEFNAQSLDEPIPRNEYIARVLAEHVGDPSLGRIPRKSIGRPRTRHAASA